MHCALEEVPFTGAPRHELEDSVMAMRVLWRLQLLSGVESELHRTYIQHSKIEPITSSLDPESALLSA